MAIFKTSNPALSQDTFSQYGSGNLISAADRMSFQGTINRTSILLLLCVVGAAFSWSTFLSSANGGAALPLMAIGGIGGFVVAIATTFKQTWAPVTSPIYAILEGLFLGGISAVFELRYPGIAFQAVGLTFATLLVMLLLYSSGIIKVTEKLKIGIVAATGGIALFYLLQFVLSFFHIQFMSVNGSGIIGIGFSLFVVGIAALNLVLDFDFIERGVNLGAPKYMEWYGAFGIMVTLVWLYLEILRLLSKFRSRN